MLKILKKVSSIYTDGGYKVAEQRMGNSGEDAALTGVYPHIYGRD